MSVIQKELLIQQNLAGYSQLSKRLDKLEKEVMVTKKDKITRDRIDYESNNVYTWRKPPFYSD